MEIGPERRAVAGSEPEGLWRPFVVTLVFLEHHQTALRFILARFWPSCFLLLSFGSLAVQCPPLDPSLLGMHTSGDLGPLTIYQTKRGKIVAFPKAPPKCPPTPAQNTQRYRFRTAIANWKLLSDSQRLSYEQVTLRLSLCMTGLNLWIHVSIVHDFNLLDTLQHQTGIFLSKPPGV